MSLRLDVQILRTPFALTNAQLATRPYGGVDSSFEVIKAKQLREHLETLADWLSLLPGDLEGVDTKYVDRTSPDYDGQTGEWYSVVMFDRKG